jgi:formate/nitrite transporter FocA (FNT family)
VRPVTHGSLTTSYTPPADVIVFLGNLAGSLFFAAILVRYADLSTAAITNFIVMTAQTRAVTTAWHAQFLRGIGCNIMVRSDFCTMRGMAEPGAGQHGRA